MSDIATRQVSAQESPRGGRWWLDANANSLAMLYAAAAVGGIGAGAVYGTCAGNALK
jgi:MFS transporter, OFA family, oxalate/formate antiporter